MPKYLIEFNGKVASLSEHCRDLGIKISTVQSRHFKTGEPYEKCLEYYQNNGVKFIRHKYKIKDKRLYKIWAGTKQKCYNPKHVSYKNYGEKGIKVCERWQIYENFENDLLDSFLEHIEQYGIKDTSIDRWPNNNGNYEPNNVRWATRKEQANNRNSNHMLTEDLNCTQFAEKYGLNPNTVIAKANKGMSAEEILNTSIGYIKYYLPCNQNLKTHCHNNGYCYDVILANIYNYNLEPHEALARYLKNRKK